MTALALVLRTNAPLVPRRAISALRGTASTVSAADRAATITPMAAMAMPSSSARSGTSRPSIAEMLSPKPPER